MESSNKQKKIARIIQKDLSIFFQSENEDIFLGLIVSVSEVKLIPDLSEARVYLTVFPENQKDKLIEWTNAKKKNIRYWLAKRIKDQLRRIPMLDFFYDNSLEYIQKIDSSLRGEEVNPVYNPEILEREKNIKN